MGTTGRGEGIGRAEVSGTDPSAGGGGASPGAVNGGRDSGPLVLTAPNGGGGEAAEYAAYFALLRRRVTESLIYPPAARRLSLTGTVHVDLDIQPTGVISQVTVVSSSSHRVLDEAAVEAVRDLGRLAFPPGVRPRQLRVRLPVVFDLR